ncbi:MAG: DUF4835 family protein [Dysgonamonadaceae bacterium]|jgi:hypothetical protein|nr:DUF4835 family protein [Dysgonamonadaceae bacterium]
MINRHFIACFLFFTALAAHAQAQELNAKVTVNSERIQSANKNVFATMERAVTQFINGTRWTATTFAVNEKIDCSFAIQITEQPSDNQFKAELFVQARRPVYNSSYTTSLINYRDTKFEFEYQENSSIERQQNTINSNLEAVLSFYAYLILALDFDSFSPMGGTMFFREAQNIASMAQSAGWNGWSAFDDSKSRGSMINSFLDENMKKYRELWYNYHRKSLDEMAANPDRGRLTILALLPVLKEIRQVRSSELVLQMFADAKLDEIVSIAGKATQEEKKETYELLRNVYPAMSNQLNDLRK